MSPHLRRTLRMPAVEYDAAEAWAGAHPERALWLRAEEHRCDDGTLEHVVHESIRAQHGAASPPPRARLFVLRWAEEPASVAPRVLKQLYESGAAGGVFMPAPGSKHPACGLFFHERGAGVDGLAALQLAGAGVRQFALDRWAAGAAQALAPARPRPAWRLLAGVRLVIAGAAQGAAVALALAEHGAPRLALLDGGRRVGLGALATMEGLVPESIGRFKVDALADAVAAPSGRPVSAHACATDGLHAALSRLAPDIVICCEPDRLRRAALAAWCAQRQRVWIDIAVGTAPRRARAAAAASLRVHLPALGATADGGIVQPPHSRDLFDELPLPHERAAFGDESVVHRALQYQAGRAAVQALHDLLAGRVPRPVHIRVVVGANGRTRAWTIEANDGDEDWEPAVTRVASQTAAMH